MKKLLLALGISLILIVTAWVGFHFIIPTERVAETSDPLVNAAADTLQPPAITEENAEETSPTFTEQEIESMIDGVTSDALQPPAVTEENAEETRLTFTEQEIASMIDEITSKTNLPVEVDYVQIHLYQDRMLVSGQGEALGIKAKTEGIEVWFEDNRVFASGEVDISGGKVKMKVEAQIDFDQGKPCVEIQKIQAGILPIPYVLKNRLTTLINSAIEDIGLRFPVEINSIYIKDGKLILTGGN